MDKHKLAGVLYRYGKDEVENWLTHPQKLGTRAQFFCQTVSGR